MRDGREQTILRDPAACTCAPTPTAARRSTARWYANGQRVNRALGVKRPRGSREGLTATQAEDRLRELIAETTPDGGAWGPC